MTYMYDILWGRHLTSVRLTPIIIIITLHSIQLNNNELTFVCIKTYVCGLR